MKAVLHPSQTRGHADRGWLKAYHTFSFADYYDPARVHFGALRVLNDDTIAGGHGFPAHPHDNMEIITIPLAGVLEHRDSMGNAGVIRKGEVQVMSAGTGVTHSEANADASGVLQLLQIWLFPKNKNVAPRYQQIALPDENAKNNWQQIVSPNEDDAGAWIHQNAWFHLGRFDAGSETEYQLKNDAHGLYVFVIEGEVEIEGQTLSRRDGLAITQADSVAVRVIADSEILLMEVPLH
jgi:redox-sensitive bicupin YhaK (pirin superfamily)